MKRMKDMREPRTCRRMRPIQRLSMVYAAST